MCLTHWIIGAGVVGGRIRRLHRSRLVQMRVLLQCTGRVNGARRRSSAAPRSSSSGSGSGTCHLCWCRACWDSLAPLDDGLAHANRTLCAVQLLVQSARIADVVAIFIASPEWSRCSTAIGALESSNCSLFVRFSLIRGSGIGSLVVSKRRCHPAARCLSRQLILLDALQTIGFVCYSIRHASIIHGPVVGVLILILDDMVSSSFSTYAVSEVVVKSRASIAGSVSSGAIAEAVTWTRSLLKPGCLFCRFRRVLLFQRSAAR